MILEEGNRLYPRCPQCDMFFPQKALNGRHLKTDFCRWGTEKKWSHLEEEESLEGTERAITAYGFPLFQVTFFNYMGRVLAAEYDDWLEVVLNLCQKP